MPGTLYVPERRKGKGSGHLRRTLELLREGGAADRVYLPEEGDAAHHTRLQALVNAGALIEELDESRFLSTPEMARELIASGAVDRVLFDCQELSLQELSPFAGAPLLLGVDTGGEGSEVVDFSVEALPRLADQSSANRKDPAYLSLPEQRRERWPRSIERVLITLGGEDAGGDARRLASELQELYPELRIYYTEGGTVNGPEAPFVGNHQPLREKLWNFDLVLLHFGMTLYEALYARVPVLALPVTEYHRALTDALDLDSCGSLETEVIAPELGRIVADPTEAVTRSQTVAPDESRSLSEELRELTPPGYRNPLKPVGRELDPVTARLEDRSYYRCRETGLLYMRRFLPNTIEYSERYFFEEYRRQYGRTYLEDFDHIKKMGRSRLRRICRGLPRKRRPRSGTLGGPGDREAGPEPPSLLDLGCAYGPFLQAAREVGFAAYGVDLAEEAVRYVRDELDLSAAVGRVEEIDTASLFGRKQFDAITMWYVIEHLPDLATVLSRVRDLLSPGGIFAFSTPNGEGISATTNRESFLRNSPEDHVTVWEPSRTEAILEPFGFELLGIRVTGHHPERFPLIRRSPGDFKGRLLKPLLRQVSRIKGLGDTFECYVRRR